MALSPTWVGALAKSRTSRQLFIGKHSWAAVGRNFFGRAALAP